MCLPACLSARGQATDTDNKYLPSALGAALTCAEEQNAIGIGSGSDSACERASKQRPGESVWPICMLLAQLGVLSRASVRPFPALRRDNAVDSKFSQMYLPLPPLLLFAQVSERASEQRSSRTDRRAALSSVRGDDSLYVIDTDGAN